MAQATAWTATLVMCAFVLFIIYSGILPNG
jgi:hypothetical protein